MKDITWEQIKATQVIDCPEHGRRNTVAVCSVCAGLARVAMIYHDALQDDEFKEKK